MTRQEAIKRLSTMLEEQIEEEQESDTDIERDFYPYYCKAG